MNLLFSNSRPQNKGNENILDSQVSHNDADGLGQFVGFKEKHECTPKHKPRHLRALIIFRNKIYGQNASQQLEKHRIYLEHREEEEDRNTGVE